MTAHLWKICADCKQNLPLLAEFYTAKGKHGKKWYLSCCKSCYQVRYGIRSSTPVDKLKNAEACKRYRDKKKLKKQKLCQYCTTTVGNISSGCCLLCYIRQWIRGQYRNLKDRSTVEAYHEQRVKYLRDNPLLLLQIPKQGKYPEYRLRHRKSILSHPYLAFNIDNIQWVTFNSNLVRKKELTNVTCNS